MVPMSEIALEMSIGCPKFSIDWNYCDEKTEIFKKDLATHEIYHFKNEFRVMRDNFRKLASDEEKIGDVIMLVRPPIFMLSRPHHRQMLGRPLIVVSSVPEYEELTDSHDEISISQILRQV